MTWTLKSLGVTATLIATLLAGTAWYAHSKGRQSGMLQIQTQWDAQRLAAERLHREAMQALQADHQRQLRHTMEVAHDTETQLARARADAVAAADAGRRLRAQIAALSAGGGAGTATGAAATPGPATDATAAVLADVQRRLDDAADQLAAFADHAHAAGRACERIYDGAVTRAPGAD